MAQNEVMTMAGEGKALDVSPGDSEQGKRDCDMAIAKLSFLEKVLKIKDDSDEADLILTWYERHGLAGILADVQNHLSAIWSGVLSPVSKYVGETREVDNG